MSVPQGKPTYQDLAVRTALATVDLRALEKQVRALATDRPTFVYITPPGSKYCRYAYNGAPSCIAGQALHQLGIPIADLELMDSIGDATAIDDVLSAVRTLDADERRIVRWLVAVQVSQDICSPWQDAIDYADGLRDSGELEDDVCLEAEPV